MRKTKLIAALFVAGLALCFAEGKVDTETETETETESIPKGFVKVAGGTIEGKDNGNNFNSVFIKWRTVTLSSFLMCDHEVTQGEWKAVMTGNAEGVSDAPSVCTADNSYRKVAFGTVQENRPVEYVTWYDAVYYCNLLSAKEGLAPAYTIEDISVSSGHITRATVNWNKAAGGYRLPTEAEWEYAARGGDPAAADWDYTFSGAAADEGTSYYDSKNAGMDSVGWYCYNNNTWSAENWSGKAQTGENDVTNSADGCGTHEVKQLQPNALGLYDMSGNVFEWCWDWYNGDVSEGEETDPVGAYYGRHRVVRGGSWGQPCYYADVCTRRMNHDRGYDPNECGGSLGFRVVRSSSN